MRIRLYIILLTYLIFMPLYLYAEDNVHPPSEPEITLPPLLMEVEDLSIKGFKVPIPEEDILPPQTVMPLPEEFGIDVKKQMVDIAPEFIDIKQSNLITKNKIKTEATLGIGTLNNFFSDISVSSYGGNPEGELTYNHDSADKFSGNPPSRGYGSRSDKIRSFLSYKRDKIEIKGEASFDEEEIGLQNNSDYFSRINRFMYLNSEMIYKISSRTRINGKINTEAASQNLTGGTDLYRGSIEYHVVPSFELLHDFNRGSVSAGVFFDYTGNSRNDISGVVNYGLYGDVWYDLSEMNRLNLYLKGNWKNNSSFYLPFKLAVVSDINDYLSINMSASYIVKQNLLYDSFRKFLLIDVPIDPGMEKDWNFKLVGRWVPISDWVITASINYTIFDGRVDIGKNLNDNGLFDYRLIEGDIFGFNSGIRWIINPIFSTRVKFELNYGDLTAIDHIFSGEISINGISEHGRLGGSAGLKLTFNRRDNKSLLPQMNLNGFYNVKEYIRFSIDINDMLLPFTNIKRYIIYPYLDRGFYIMFKTSILF